MADIQSVEQRVDELLAQLNVSHSTSGGTEKNPFDIVPAVCTYFDLETERSQPEKIISGKEVLVLLAEICKSKELLLALLEQAEGFKDDIKFIMLLEPISKCIQKLPGKNKKFDSVTFAAITLYCHLASQPRLNDTSECVEEFIADPRMENVCSVIQIFLSFLRPFVEELAWKRPISSVDSREDLIRHRRDLSFILIKVLDCPLGYFPLSDDCENPSIVRKSVHCSNLCASLIELLQPDLVKFIVDVRRKNELIQKKNNFRTLQNRSVDDNEDDMSELDNTSDLTPERGLGVLLYLVAVKHACSDSVPQVYSHRQILESHIQLLTLLLQDAHPYVIEKGVASAIVLLDRVGPNKIEGNFVDWDDTQALVRAIATAMSTAKVKKLGQMAMKLFVKLLKVFQPEGRSKLLMFILKTVDHIGIQGFTITMVKNEVDEALRFSPPDASFLGPPLKRLLELIFLSSSMKFCILSEKKKGSLLEHNDRIMSALNLLRYLLIRDTQKCNVTGIWDLLSKIEDRFLKPLRSEINMTRASCLNEISKVRAGEKAQEDDSSCEIGFSVAGRNLEDLTDVQRLEAMEAALINLDMMESVLSRTELFSSSSETQKSEKI